jgi:hypothetical protein
MNYTPPPTRDPRNLPIAIGIVLVAALLVKLLQYFGVIGV